MRARFHPRFLALLCAFAIGACSVFGGWPLGNSFSALKVIADPQANQNSATALDIVFIYDPTLVAQLPKSGPAWFETRTKLMATFAKNAEVVSLEVPPAYAIESVALPSRYKDAVAVYAFANYVSEAGQYPMNLTSFNKPVMHLQPGAIVYAER